MSTVEAPLTASAAELRQVFGVNPATLRQWYRRGQVARLDRDRYVVADVAARLARLGVDSV